jgi:hypothetical protein
MSATFEQRSAAAKRAWVTIRANRAVQRYCTEPVSLRSNNNLSLLPYIRSRGGINLGCMVGETRRFRESNRGRQPGVFVKRARLTWEEMQQDCSEAGYGPYETAAQFFDAIDAECRGILQYSGDRDPQAVESAEWGRHVQEQFRQGSCPTCGQSVECDAGIGAL